MSAALRLRGCKAALKPSREVILVQRRIASMAALENASSDGDSKLLAGSVAGF